MALKSILRIDIRHILVTDSKVLFDTVTTLHEGKDYRLLTTVQQIETPLTLGIYVLFWVQGKVNILNALMKCNLMSHRSLNLVAVSGKL